MAGSGFAFAATALRRSVFQWRRVASPPRYFPALLLMFTWPIAVHAGDAAFARGMASTCTNCHASTARGPAVIPVIAGRNKGELLQLLKEFKSGARPATVMHQLAKGFSDEQLEVLAGYFSTVRPDAGGARN